MVAITTKNARARLAPSVRMRMMAANVRSFDAGPDPFGRVWHVEFQWLQNAISIRHADTVDVKFSLVTAGEEKQEKVIALPHAHLREIARSMGRSLSDPWCMRLAAQHIRRMVSSFEDMEKTLITLPKSALQEYAHELESSLTAAGGR
jgi:hypothetical protein